MAVGLQGCTAYWKRLSVSLVTREQSLDIGRTRKAIRWRRKSASGLQQPLRRRGKLISIRTSVPSPCSTHAGRPCLRVCPFSLLPGVIGAPCCSCKQSCRGGHPGLPGRTQSLCELFGDSDTIGRDEFNAPTFGALPFLPSLAPSRSCATLAGLQALISPPSCTGQPPAYPHALPVPSPPAVALTPPTPRVA